MDITQNSITQDLFIVLLIFTPMPIDFNHFFVDYTMNQA